MLTARGGAARVSKSTLGQKSRKKRTIGMKEPVSKTSKGHYRKDAGGVAENGGDWKGETPHFSERSRKEKK